MPQKPFQTVETDCGPADCFHQGPRAKLYKCPMCEEDVDHEWHVVIRPKSNHDLRRHGHLECLDAFAKNGLTIRLLPGHR